MQSKNNSTESVTDNKIIPMADVLSCLLKKGGNLIFFFANPSQEKDNRCGLINFNL